MSRPLTAFVDESGDTNLELSKDGVSQLFIVAAVIVHDNMLDIFNDKAEALAQSYFSGSEMKSSNIGNNDKRRISILEEVLGLPCSFYALVVDKRRLFQDCGLRFKKSFFKHLHGKLDSELFKRFPFLRIIADEHGREEYMNSFCEYIEHNHAKHLFSEQLHEFEFTSSKADRGVQVADLFCGSIFKQFSRKIAGENSPNFLDLLKSKTIGVVVWPPSDFPFYQTTVVSQSHPFDHIVEQQALASAKEFLNDKTGDENTAVLDQVICLQYLLFHYEVLESKDFVYGEEIRNQLDKNRNEPIGEKTFMSCVIAPLRDNGVMIVSSSKGYKLPSCVFDLSADLNYNSYKIAPRLLRLGRIRDAFKLATNNKLDLFTEANVDYLGLAYESLRDAETTLLQGRALG